MRERKVVDFMCRLSRFVEGIEEVVREEEVGLKAVVVVVRVLLVRIEGRFLGAVGAWGVC